MKIRLLQRVKANTPRYADVVDRLVSFTYTTTSVFLFATSLSRYK